MLDATGRAGSLTFCRELRPTVTDRWLIRAAAPVRVRRTA
jgi:hypothetical protein